MTTPQFQSKPRVTMTAPEVLDMYYLDMRCALLEVAAGFDRIDRLPDADVAQHDERLHRLQDICRLIPEKTSGNRVETVLNLLSDMGENGGLI